MQGKREKSIFGPCCVNRQTKNTDAAEAPVKISLCVIINKKA